MHIHARKGEVVSKFWLEPYPSVAEALATHIHFDNDTMWVDLADGRQLGVPLAYFPRLLRATPAQRDQHTISGGGTGLHWDDLDEDISVPALLMGIGDWTRSAA